MKIKERIAKAFGHQIPDRTPLFEIFWAYHPIYWDICGRTIATDEAMAWDARADGIAWEEFVEAEARAQFNICKFFGLDMVHPSSLTPRNYPRPVKTGRNSWTLDGVKYLLNERTKLFVLANPGESDSYTHKISEEKLKKEIEIWNTAEPAPVSKDDVSVMRRMKETS